MEWKHGRGQEGKKVTGQWSEHIPRAVVVAWNIAHIRILIAALETRVLT